MSEHEQKADKLERELDDLQHRSDGLHEEIEGAEEKWESRKRDERVPGATGELDDEGGGDDDVSADDLDFGRDVDKSDIVGEAPAPSDEDDSDDDEKDG